MPEHATRPGGPAASPGPRRPAIPDPLAPGRWPGRLWTLDLPGALLSWASLASLLIVLAAVQHSAALRLAYRFFLPGPWPWLAAVAAAGLAWAIAVAGSRRPGPFWPRLWALLLALAATLTAAGALLGPAWLPQAQAEALVTAVLAAVLTLCPRLLRLRPDSDWTPRVAPASLALTLALIVPPALMGGPAPDPSASPLPGPPTSVGPSRRHTPPSGSRSVAPGLSAD